MAAFASSVVELLRELRRRGLQRALAPLAVGVGDLIEPGVLQPGEGGQQHQHGCGEHRDERAAAGVQLESGRRGGRRLITSRV